MDSLQNVNISSTHMLPSPEAMRTNIYTNEQHKQFIKASRDTVINILKGKDSRLLLIVGPCSIHNVEAGLEYAHKLKKLAEEVKDKFFVVMRAYFEKPRTSLGWKGLIHDPHLDGSNNLPQGIHWARQFLLDLAEIQLPAATELLDPITPEYLSDLITWSAIGARTAESQLHRQLASGFPMPVGFKNSTEGAISPAVQAIKAAQQAQTFLHINAQGQVAYSLTKGNQDCHLILRGSIYKPNYYTNDIFQAAQLLEDNGLSTEIIVDCAHGNAQKKPLNQLKVFREVLKNLPKTPQVRGLMLESNLEAGNQPFPSTKNTISPNISITDPCISFKETENLVKAGQKKPRNFYSEA